MKLSSLLKLHKAEYNSAGFKLQGRKDIAGMNVAIENRKGSVRKWFDKEQNETGRTKMRHPYGYIEGTIGNDGDELDVFVGPLGHNCEHVFIIHQRDPQSGQYDEDKCMVGFGSAGEAKTAYLEHYNHTRFYAGMTQMPLYEFVQAVENNNRRRKRVSFNGKGVSL